jgi:hypothetical protein
MILHESFLVEEEKSADFPYLRSEQHEKQNLHPFGIDCFWAQLKNLSVRLVLGFDFSS